MDYDDYVDEMNSIDGMDYDLREDMDSTVAYAVQLAMKDKEERLVDQALERIRRAQKQGQKNVRLSGREMEALERKRMQANRTPDHDYRNTSPQVSPGGSRSSKPPDSPSSKRGAQRSGSNASTAHKHSMPSPLAENNAAYAFWAWTSGASGGSPASARSPSARTPTSQAPPRSPLQPAYAFDRLASVPQIHTPAGVKSPSVRSLPDDPQWAPPYPPPYTREPPPYPTDRRRPEPTSYMSGYRSVFNDSARSNRRGVTAMPGAATEERLSPEEEEEQGNSSDDSAMVERRVAGGTPTRGPIGRGSRPRSSRP
ncbi:hypothetical protein CBS63078_10642 [Aspergillus niger]|uniref:Prenylated rab acceptor 1 n=2 Tax=Aspergillus niger TaxID=5061 RepID=G3YEK9_ASPNA|nr:hypothetical protein ASPNIDRAFT_43028 [Aspergillus niger ATCC 1015]KAI2820562.1 hypothetical protein CBS133816_9784 [Aspergillus niger]KAI2837946.1 hypothetical protein CBS11350_8481 [Aspergillus niger]KAI2848938.1 hypothetical protein CBS12448_8986 [Aspergillus niger]KAI2872825.1 hypothetical protein CBS13152_9951 [Aspergillus niger]